MRLRGLPPPRRAFEPPKLFHRPPLLPAPVPRPGSNAGERQDTPAPTHAAQPRPRDRHCDTGTPHAAHCLTAPCVWRTRHQHPRWLLIHGLGGHLVTSRRWGCQSYPPCSGRGNGRQHAARKDAAAWSGPRGPQAHAPAPGARAEARRGEGAGGGWAQGSGRATHMWLWEPPLSPHVFHLVSQSWSAANRSSDEMSLFSASCANAPTLRHASHRTGPSVHPDQHAESTPVPSPAPRTFLHLFASSANMAAMYFGI